MTFPKKCILPEGSIYEVTFKHIKWDWIETVKQFDDLSEEEKDDLINSFDDQQAEIWWHEQCDGLDIIRLGRKKGVDREIRKQFLKDQLLISADGWAYEFEEGTGDRYERKGY